MQARLSLGGDPVRRIILPEFWRDYDALSPGDQEMVRNAVPLINQGYREHGVNFVLWPRSLRVNSMKYRRGVYEITFCFSGPDLRGSFMIERDDDGADVLIWLTVGNHRRGYRRTKTDR